MLSALNMKILKIYIKVKEVLYIKYLASHSCKNEDATVC